MRIGQVDLRITEIHSPFPKRLEIFEAAQRQRKLGAERRTHRLVAIGIDRTAGIPQLRKPGRTQRATDGTEIAGIAKPVEREQKRIPRRTVVTRFRRYRSDREHPLRIDRRRKLLKLLLADDAEFPRNVPHRSRTAFGRHGEADQFGTTQKKLPRRPYPFAETAAGLPAAVAGAERTQQ